MQGRLKPVVRHCVLCGRSFVVNPVAQTYFSYLGTMRTISGSGGLSFDWPALDSIAVPLFTIRNKNPKNSDCETRWLVYSWDKITPQGMVSWKKRLVPLLKRILKQGVPSDQMADGYVVRFPNFPLYSRGTRLGEMVQKCVP